VAYQKGHGHASYRTIREFLRDVIRVDVTSGYLAKVIGKASAALKAPYDELLEALPTEAVLNIDETGHKNLGKRHWTWCFRALLFVLFKVDPRRSSDVLIEVLGKEFKGVIGADYFSAYHKYMGSFGVLLQFCLAHLIRDVKYLTTLPDKVTQNYGNRVLDKLRAMFKVIHRRETMDPDAFQRALELARDDLIKTAKCAPQRGEAQNMAKRFRTNADSYFRFITTPGVEPTNNLAEQAIRFVVIDRRITQGTRGENGQRWSERIWTTIATCTQQGRSVFDFLNDAVTAHFHGKVAPSLRPTSL
jgi:transposase